MTYVVHCMTCEDRLLYANPGHERPQELFHECDLAYPATPWLDSPVPRDVREAYLDAVRVRSSSGAVFIRGISFALQMVCADVAAQGDTLGAQFHSLAERGLTPGILAEQGAQSKKLKP